MSPSTRTRSRPSATDARVTLIEFDEEEPAPKRVKSSPTKTPKPLKLELEAHEAHPAPKRWRETWDILSEQVRLTLLHGRKAEATYRGRASLRRSIRWAVQKRESWRTMQSDPTPIRDRDGFRRSFLLCYVRLFAYAV